MGAFWSGIVSHGRAVKNTPATAAKHDGVHYLSDAEVEDVRIALQDMEKNGTVTGEEALEQLRQKLHRK